jgi:hypothetical protein
MKGLVFATPRSLRSLVKFLVLALLALAGCGGGVAQSKLAPAHRAMGPNDTRAVSATTESDHDGIPDDEDRAPPADAKARSELAAPMEKTPATTTPTPAPAPSPPSTPVATPEPPARDPAMIIYTARVTMAVYQVDQGVAAVEKIAHDMGGFLAKKGDREITIRVPRARFEAAIAAVDKIGDVLHRDIEAQDVTDEYVDLEVRIKNARAMQTRLKQLLEKAAVKDALEIEKELHRVTEDLERMEGKLKVLKDKIAYSTITVTFQPRNAALQATQIRLPFPWLSDLGLPNLLSLSEAK